MWYSFSASTEASAPVVLYLHNYNYHVYEVAKKVTYFSNWFDGFPKYHLSTGLPERSRATKTHNNRKMQSNQKCIFLFELFCVLTDLQSLVPNILYMQSFLMRKHFFHNEERGYFKTEQRAAANPMQAMGGMYGGGSSARVCVCVCVRGGGAVCVFGGWERRRVCLGGGGTLLSYTTITQHTPI